MLVAADRFYPSSKTCSECGAARAKLGLSERVFTCDACGLALDRDLNAALNLARVAQQHAQAEGNSSPLKREDPTGSTQTRKGLAVAA
jgi:putative transposase